MGSHRADHAEITELDALRLRAYGPDADILGDQDAIARLSELEARVLLERFPLRDDQPPAAARAMREEAVAPITAPVAAPPTAVVLTPEDRAPRSRAGLLAGAAVAAVLLGAAAWSSVVVSTTAVSTTAVSTPAPAAAPATADSAEPSALTDEQRAAASQAGYKTYIDGLRDEVLALAGSSAVAESMIRDQLRPYGILYGRTVGAGTTVDNEFCMIIAELPEASITCIPVENAYANPVSVVLPSWYSDAESDVFTRLGELVSYTLMPGGSVVAVPADSADSAAAVASPGPTATAVPPPRWQ